MVTINQLLKKSNAPISDSIIVLCKLLKVDKSHIYTYGDKELSEEIQERFLALTEKVGRGYPIQYALGEREFMGLDFYLEEGVLIPRPDTEILVEYIIEYINTEYQKKNINVLDIGIGSGAISLSIAHYCKDVFVYGIDISDTAIKVANINKDRLDLSNVAFYKGDLFQAIEGMDRRFQIIVSNPPYIASDEIKDLDRNVKDFEPILALDGGMDGLDFYRRITPESKKFLDGKGLLIYEIGYNQGEAVKEILISEEFEKVSILKDLQDHDRVVLGIRR